MSLRNLLCETCRTDVRIRRNLREITVTVIRTVARYALNGDSVLVAFSLGYLHKMTQASNALISNNKLLSKERAHRELSKSIFITI